LNDWIPDRVGNDEIIKAGMTENVVCRFIGGFDGFVGAAFRNRPGMGASGMAPLHYILGFFRRGGIQLPPFKLSPPLTGGVHPEEIHPEEIHPEGMEGRVEAGKTATRN